MLRFSQYEAANHISFGQRLIPQNRKRGDFPPNHRGGLNKRLDFEAINAYLSKFDDKFLSDLDSYLRNECLDETIPPGSNVFQLRQTISILKSMLSNNALLLTKPSEDDADNSGEEGSTKSGEQSQEDEEENMEDLEENEDS